MKQCPPDQVQTAREILDYLSRRPGEEDTMDAIMQQQLPERPSTRQTTLVKEVIGDLVTQGLIERIRRDDRTLYRVRSRP